MNPAVSGNQQRDMSISKGKQHSLTLLLFQQTKTCLNIHLHKTPTIFLLNENFTLAVVLWCSQELLPNSYFYKCKLVESGFESCFSSPPQDMTVTDWSWHQSQIPGSQLNLKSQFLPLVTQRKPVSGLELSLENFKSNVKEGGIIKICNSMIGQMSMTLILPGLGIRATTQATHAKNICCQYTIKHFG